MSKEGLPKSWYPATLSADLSKSPRAVRMFGRDYILFRRQNGDVSALERYCLHMGADLSRGSLDGDKLRCPLHGWLYNPDGVCINADLQEQQSPASLKRLATHEVGGIVFIWPGEQPDWPFPEVPGLRSPRTARPRREQLACPLEAIGLNGFDIWHYQIVHRRRVREGTQVRHKAPHHIGLTFSADVLPGKLHDNMLIKLGYGTLKVQLDYWGGNLIFVRNQSGGYLAIIALAPDGADDCEMFLGVLAEKTGSFTRAALQGLTLEFFRAVAWGFLKSDMPAVSGMRPKEGLLIEGKDDIAMDFWRWWHALPRLAEDMS